MLFLSRLTKLPINNPVNSLIILIFIFGTTLRLLGTYPGFNPYHPDEGKGGYASAWHMFTNNTLEPVLYSYLSLTSYIQLITQIFILIPLLWVKFFLVNPELFIQNLNNLKQFFPDQIIGKGDLILMYWGRLITVFFSLLVMIFTYLTSKKLFVSKVTGAFALLALATNFRSIMSSHIDLPDTYNAFFLIFSLWLVLRLKEKSSLIRYMLAGLGVALAMSVKVQFFSLIPFILTHIYISLSKNRSAILKVKYLFSAKILMAISTILLALIVINFIEFYNFTKFINTISLETKKYGLGVFKFNWAALYYIYHILLTPFVFWSVIFGVFIGLKRNMFSTVLILSVVIPFAAFFLYLTEGAYYTRNFVTIVPFLCIGSAIFLTWLHTKLKKSLLFILIFIIFFQPIKNSLIHVFYNIQPWSLITTRNWLNDNLAKGITIAIHPWDKYILFSLPEIDVKKQLNFVPLDASTTYSLAEIRDQRATYALLGTDIIGDSSVWYMSGKQQRWGKPDNVSGNNFIILSAKELFENTAFYGIKPWQSPDNNYVLVSIPPEIKMTNIKQALHYKFSYDQAISWIKIDGSADSSLSYDLQKGHDGYGSILVTKREKTGYPFIRVISPIFTFEPNQAYILSGWIKASRLLEKNHRDGFFRVDFYDEIPKSWDMGTTSIQTNLSQRYYGQGDWVQEVIVANSPGSAKYATVSFQLSGAHDLDFWISDIKLHTGLSVHDSKNNDNQVFKLYKNVVFPYLNGNM